ncbi:MAG: haloacid dehalogenase-like hydrolase, partial [Cytophagales bacterium]|nr:haloacid dehalogenase-like hydrolase [Cytophaga sp.]
MKTRILLCVAFVSSMLVFSCGEKKTLLTVKDTTATEAVSSDPLSSWNEGPLKQSIIDYVTKVSKEGSPDFIPVADRVATFDNDGTLWAEQPVIQGLFGFYMAGKMMKANPALAKNNPFKAIASHDTAYLHHMDMKSLVELVILTHKGMTEETFDADSKEF